jgi:MFS family permease|tara:strand:+ start:76185 stop:77351 length:1167 start_codon:yes stop_codon:yes gene_type:complete
MQPHHRLYASFFAFSFTLGSFFSRLPDIQTSLGAKESELGLVLIGSSLGALTGLTFAAPVIARLGTRLAIAVPLMGIAALCAAVPYAPTLTWTFSVLLLQGMMVGALEVCLNVETDRRAASLGHGIMSRAHSLWSFGFFVAALIGAVVRQFGVPTWAHLTGVIPIVAFIIATVVLKIRPAPVRTGSSEMEGPLFALPTLGMLGLCLIAFSPMLAEGAGVDWSLIYMRDVFASDPIIAGLALSAFTLVMAVARWFADPVVDRLGARMATGWLLSLVGGGALMIAIAPNAASAIIGFTMMGLGCSAVYPITISAAAQRTDRPAAINVAALGQSAFVIFFLGPPLLGFVAEYFGIRSSYLVCLPIVVASLFCLRSLNGPQPKTESAVKHGT